MVLRKFKGLINITLENPFKTWWKARKYFKRPKMKVGISWSKSHCPYAWTAWKGKILDIRITDVMWKDKWNSPRHEGDPVIYICLFNYLNFYITLGMDFIDEWGETKDESMIYWEYILDYVYYSHTLKLNSSWCMTSQIFTKIKFGSEEDGSKDIREFLTLPIPTHLISLNKRGLKEFKKLYEQARNNLSN